MKLRKFIATTIREYLTENLNRDRDDILKKSEIISNSGKRLNCHLFSQLLLDYTDKKQDLLKLNFNVVLNKNKIKNIEKLEIGDLLEFNNISHYSIYIGNYEVIEVEQWGDSPRITSIYDVLDTYEGTTSVYRKK